MADTFEMTDEAKEAWPTMSENISRAAFEMAGDFIALGLREGEATSVVASALVRAAWEVAGIGRIAEGGTPNPERFMKVAKEATEIITWPEEPDQRDDVAKAT